MQVYVGFRSQAFRPRFQSVDCRVLIEEYYHNTEIKKYTDENDKKVTDLCIYLCKRRFKKIFC